MFFAALILLAGMAEGCGSRDEMNKVNEETNEPENGGDSAEAEDSAASAQMRLLAENREMWIDDPDYANDLYQYAVTDLDRNGRYELIVSHMGGSDAPTSSAGYLDVFTNDQGELCYVVYDTIRNGAAEYYQNVRSLTLKDEQIEPSPIAYRSMIYDEESFTVTCEDAEGNVIPEEAYERAADDYFSGWQKDGVWLGWQDVRELAGDTEGIAAQLEQSLEIWKSTLP